MREKNRNDAWKNVSYKWVEEDDDDNAGRANKKKRRQHKTPN